MPGAQELDNPLNADLNNVERGKFLAMKCPRGHPVAVQGAGRAAAKVSSVFCDVDPRTIIMNAPQEGQIREIPLIQAYHTRARGLGGAL